MASLTPGRSRLETDLIEVAPVTLDLRLLVSAVTTSLAVDLYDDERGGLPDYKARACGAMSPEEQFALLALLAGLIDGSPEGEFDDASRLVAAWRDGHGVEAVVRDVLHG